MESMDGEAAVVRRGWIEARGERIPVLFLEPRAARGDLLFLHGYGRDPRDYLDLLGRLSADGWRIVAPFIFGNGGLRRTPVTFWACAALAHRAVEGLLAAGELAHGAPAFGHSTGGAVTLTLGGSRLAPSSLVAINPVQPSRAPSPLFMLRSAWMNTKMALGLAGDGAAARRVLLESGGRFYLNWLKSPLRNYALIAGLRAYSHERLGRWADRRPRLRGKATVLYGHGDEFYPSCKGLEEGLAGVFEHSEVVELEEQNSHEWLMFRPALAVGLLTPALAPC